MFGGTDRHKLEFLWIDGKKHTVEVKEADERVDLKDLRDTFHKMIEDKEDQCKDIYYLGLGLSGHPAAARGFLYGWLVKSIRDSLEKAGKEKWKISHDMEELSEEETREHVALQLEELAKTIREDDEYKVKKAPVLRGDADGTELFS